MKINWLTFISRHWNIATDHGMEYGPWAGYEAYWSPNIMYPLCIYYVPVWARCDGCDVYWLIRSILPLCSTQLISYTYRNRHVSNVFQCSDLCLLLPKLFFHVGRAFHTIRIYSLRFAQMSFITTWMNLELLSAKTFTALSALCRYDLLIYWQCWNPSLRRGCK